MPPPTPSYNVAGGKLVRTDTPVQSLIATKDAVPAMGFEPTGGDAGWALSQHKYVFAGGRLAMSDDCDHAIRTARRRLRPRSRPDGSFRRGLERARACRGLPPKRNVDSTLAVFLIRRATECMSETLSARQKFSR